MPAGRGLAVSRGPALEQPARRVRAARRPGPRAASVPSAATLRSTALSIGTSRACARCGQPHRLADRGVGRRAEEEELGAAEPEHVGDARRLRAVAEEGQDGLVDLPEAPQHGRDQEAGEGAVAHRQPLEAAVLLEHLVERPRLGGQHLVEHVERHLAGRDRGRPRLALGGERGRGLGHGTAARLAAGEPRPVIAAAARGVPAGARGGRAHSAAASRASAELDQRHAVGDAVERDEGAEARALALAEQHLVEARNQSRSSAKRVALADLVDLVLDRLGVARLGHASQQSRQLLQRRALLSVGCAVALRRARRSRGSRRSRARPARSRHGVVSGVAPGRVAADEAPEHVRVVGVHHARRDSAACRS